MMIYYTRFFLFWFAISMLFTSCSKKSTPDETSQTTQPVGRLAVVTSSVCDVIGSAPTAHHFGEKRYEELPCSFVQTSFARWWQRIHQLLFNQIVYVKKVVQGEAYIEIPNVKIQPSPHGHKENLKGWILCKNILFLDELPKQSLETLPDPFHFSLQKKKKEYLTLIAPMYISSLNQSFSAATNFIVKSKTSDGFICTLMNPTTKEPMDILFPMNACIKSQGSSHKEKMRAFIGLLRKWTKVDDGCIPYVLGGASFLTPYSKQFVKTPLKKGTKVFYVYDRKSSNSFQSGMDCTTIIYLAANCVGFNYDLKNTTSIKHSMKALTRHDTIEVGDIIYRPGHVMVISQIRPLKIIQSRGYSPGIGRVIENEAHEFLKSIDTIDDLAHMYFKGRPLVYKDMKASFKEWKIYKFSEYVKR